MEHRRYVSLAFWSSERRVLSEISSTELEQSPGFFRDSTQEDEPSSEPESATDATQYGLSEAA